MKTPVQKVNRVKISSESALSLRLSVVESKLDRVLSLLEHSRKGPDIDPEIMQDAIRAHIRGDRGPMDVLERLWELGQVDEGKFSLSCVLGTRGINHG